MNMSCPFDESVSAEWQYLRNEHVQHERQRFPRGEGDTECNRGQQAYGKTNAKKGSLAQSAEGGHFSSHRGRCGKDEDARRETDKIDEKDSRRKRWGYEAGVGERKQGNLDHQMCEDQPGSSDIAHREKDGGI